MPDEILKGSTDEKFSNVPGNEKKDAEKSKLSPVEQYYLRTFHLDRDKKDSDKRTEAKKKDPNASSRYGNAGLLEEDEDSDADLPPGLRETQRALKSLSGITNNFSAISPGAHLTLPFPRGTLASPVLKPDTTRQLTSLKPKDTKG